MGLRLGSCENGILDGTTTKTTAVPEFNQQLNGLGYHRFEGDKGRRGKLFLFNKSTSKMATLFSNKPELINLHYKR